jgi:hypothetical protein
MTAGFIVDIRAYESASSSSLTLYACKPWNEDFAEVRLGARERKRYLRTHLPATHVRESVSSRRFRLGGVGLTKVMSGWDEGLQPCSRAFLFCQQTPSIIDDLDLDSVQTRVAPIRTSLTCWALERMSDRYGVLQVSGARAIGSSIWPAPDLVHDIWVINVMKLSL